MHLGLGSHLGAPTSQEIDQKLEDSDKQIKSLKKEIKYLRDDVKKMVSMMEQDGLSAEVEYVEYYHPRT